MQKYFIDLISFLDLGGCWLDLHGMSYHQSGQKHILLVAVDFVLFIYSVLFTFLLNVFFHDGSLTGMTG